MAERVLGGGGKMALVTAKGIGVPWAGFYIATKDRPGGKGQNKYGSLLRRGQ